jgi:glutamine synthetase
VQEDDVKFIRLAFCDVFGKQKNISILPDELGRAFDSGIAFDASAIAGFCDEAHSDLLLRPDPATLTQLPWRPEHGKVVRMFSSVTYPDGTPFESDTRRLLQAAVADAEAEGLSFAFGSEQEFYLFRMDETGAPTKTPYDTACYMDIAPEDKGENIRREICLTLEQMGIRPERSHHEQGPGQNEIDFRYSDALTAADSAQTFQTVVRTVAGRSNLYADFSAKPLPDAPGNGFHINVSVRAADDVDRMAQMIAGILAHAEEMTLFLNPTENSYMRFGSDKAPRYVSWSAGNRSQLVRIPAAEGEYRRAELRSPDPTANPYLAFALLIRAGLDGVRRDLALPPAADVNLYEANERVTEKFRRLPDTLAAARQTALESDFIRAFVPQAILDSYCGR